MGDREGVDNTQSRGESVTPGPNIWSQATTLAAKTPESRNRYVDSLRALSICAVVCGHWLVAAPHATGGEVTIRNMLEYQPATQWLTWLFQVMPVFFIVGAVLVCGGLSLIALNGIGGEGFLGLRWWVLVLPFADAVVANINPLRRVAG
jgi:hypothetical protein